MTCREFTEFLGHYLSGELSPTERSVFDEHIRECPDCEAYLRTYEVTVRMGKAALPDAVGPVPTAVPEELVSAILAAKTQRAS